MQGNNGKFEQFDASALKAGIAVGRFNQDVTGKLLVSAIAKLGAYGVADENIHVEHTAGSVELPLILSSMAKSGKFDILVAIGAIIRGETAHFEYVASMVSQGVLRVTLDHHIPIGFAVLTTENEKQALERDHVGGQAAEAALQSWKTLKNIASV